MSRHRRKTIEGKLGWTQRDKHVSSKEGWHLDSGGVSGLGAPFVRIFRTLKTRPSVANPFSQPRLDVSVFKDDKEAEAHVIQQMEAGSPLHIRAWNIVVRSKMEADSASQSKDQ